MAVLRRDELKEVVRLLEKWGSEEMDWYRLSYRRRKWDKFGLLCLVILLQRTRAERVDRAYGRFFERFPTVEKLAESSYEEVEELLKELGLGLYRVKARRLVDMARKLVRDYGGRVPTSREELLKLPGVGEYTVDILSKELLGEDSVAVDSNVLRCLRRLGIARRIEEAKKVLSEILPEGKRSRFSRILMEFGMTVCKAKPECGRCPLRKYCKAKA